MKNNLRKVMNIVMGCTLFLFLLTLKDEKVNNYAMWVFFINLGINIIYDVIVVFHSAKKDETVEAFFTRVLQEVDITSKSTSIKLVMLLLLPFFIVLLGLFLLHFSNFLFYLTMVIATVLYTYNSYRFTNIFVVLFFLQGI
ncbi:hypothetical protein RJG79_09075 [Mycoplasmatota bacterium WC44]